VVPASVILGYLISSPAPLPRRYRPQISPQHFPPLSCVLLQLFENSITLRILPISPAPALFDQRVIDVGAIRQKYVGNGAPMLVEAVRLECYVFAED
jgi:hypothetical protein